MSKHRGWVFTIARTDENWEVKPVFALTMKYIIYGAEVGEGGYRHWQGYVLFNNAATMAQCKSRIWPMDATPHVEPARGTPQQAADYCKKGGEFYEHGEAPVGAGKRTDLEKARDLIQSGHRWQDVAVQDYPTVGARYLPWLKLVHSECSKPRDWVPEVVVIWGDAGVGKSRLAFDDGATPVSYVNHFVLGYDGQDTVVFDDVGIHQLPRDVWLKLCDRYPYTVNVKNGAVNWAPHKIYFTQNIEPVLDDDAYRRRITTLIHMWFGADGSLRQHVSHPAADFLMSH